MLDRSIRSILAAFAVVMFVCFWTTPATAQFAGFGPRTEYQQVPGDLTFRGAPWIAASDVDGDGHIDVVAQGVRGFSVLFNDGFGNLGNEVFYDTQVPGSPVRLVVADVNSDGFPDVAMARRGSGSEQYLSVWLNDGAGGFGQRADYWTGTTTQPVNIATGDLTGDGHIDVVIANPAPSNSVSIFQNNGDGTFAPVIVLTPPSANEVRMAFLCDINGDGHTDLLALARTTTSAQFHLFRYLNDGKGALAFAGQTNLNITTLVIDAAVADVDLDGDLDLIITAASNSVFVSKNNGAGSFGSPALYPITSGSGGQIAIGDLAGNGYPDIAVGAGGTSAASTSVLINDGNGLFGAAILYSNAGTGPRSSQAVAFADLDSNSTPDLISSSQESNFPNTTYINTRLNQTDVVAPGDFDLLSIPNNSVGMPLPETLMSWPGGGGPAPLTWSFATGFINTYTLTIALDPSLSMVVHQVTGLTGTRYNIPAGVLQTGVRYYWGVTAENAAGATLSSPMAFTFATACAADLDGSGAIDFGDLGIILGGFGAACP